jgi:hypothetical protein
MKATGLISRTIASLLLGIAVPMYAQHEQKDEKKGHPEQQQANHQQERSNPQHAQQQQQRAQNPPRAQQQQQVRNNEQRRTEQQRQVRDDQKQRGNQQARNKPEQHRIQQSTWQQHRSQRWESDHRSWRQRGGYHGYRVPDDRFRLYFGPDHVFRIYGLPFMVYRGYPRFQYGGYWITAVDPWPEYWGNNWYDNDDVYVTYVDDGYYMYNRRYPTVGIAIRISM